MTVLPDQKGSPLAAWYQARLPEHQMWYGNAQFWRDAVVLESRREAPNAFAGRNLMRVFPVFHTQQFVLLDLILTVLDVPRQRVVMAAFPTFMTGTVGASIPRPTHEQMLRMRNGEAVPSAEIAVSGGDAEVREAAARRESQIAADHGIRSLALDGPHGGKRKVYTKDVAATPAEFLEADGHSLSTTGLALVESFTRGVIGASRTWIRDHQHLEVRVERTSPVSGPTLQQSLA